MTGPIRILTSSARLPETVSEFVRVAPTPIADRYQGETARLKASFVRNNLLVLDRLGAECSAAMFAALPPEVQAVRDPKSGLGWVPFYYDVILSDALGAVAGPEVSQQWARF